MLRGRDSSVCNLLRRKETGLWNDWLITIKYQKTKQIEPARVNPLLINYHFEFIDHPSNKRIKKRQYPENKDKKKKIKQKKQGLPNDNLSNECHLPSS